MVVFQFITITATSSCHVDRSINKRQTPLPMNLILKELSRILHAQCELKMPHTTTLRIPSIAIIHAPHPMLGIHPTPLPQVGDLIESALEDISILIAVYLEILFGVVEYR